MPSSRESLEWRREKGTTELSDVVRVFGDAVDHGNAKVGDTDVVAVVEEDVIGLHVSTRHLPPFQSPVDNALPVDVVESQ